MDLEEETLDLIRKHKDGVFQNTIWKELDIDSRKCSRVLKKLLDAGKISRESAVSNGARTYLLKVKEEPSENYELLFSGDMFSPCAGCDGDCQPEYCPRLTHWIKKLDKTKEESKNLDEIKSLEELSEDSE